MDIPLAEREPQVLGWHDSHSASAALLARDGTILYAVAEERFTGRKMQKGTPSRALDDIETRFGDLAVSRCYTDLPLGHKIARNAGLAWSTWRKGLNCAKSPVSLAGTALGRFGRGRVGGIVGTDARVPAFDGLCEHHTAHAASAYCLCGFDDTYVVTIDGVGDCLSAAVFEAHAGTLKLLRKFYYNDFTVAADYETFTAMMGFNPDRHCGKITGLAAYGRHHTGCIEALAWFFEQSWLRGRRNYFDRMHEPNGQAAIAELRRIRDAEFGRFSREDLSFAMQHTAERRVIDLVHRHVPRIAGANIALAGGVFANVRINQKVKELGFANIFIAPPMDDCGLSLGAAYVHLRETTDVRPHRVPHMFLGPGYGEDEIQEALESAGVRYERPSDPAALVARLLADGKVVGRFDGRMEFGPRALGNRSILYGARDPSVNTWLNKRLSRTEFMPFAPATLAEEADRCYAGLDGCRHAAEFMTITFDCTEYMKESCPAVVHVDGTARAQLVTHEANPGLHEIIAEYRKITGIATVVNTSFNMHESPIVLSPVDAVRTFQDGRLDCLAIGPFVAEADRDAPAMQLRHRDELTEPALT